MYHVIKNHDHHTISVNNPKMFIKPRKKSKRNFSLKTFGINFLFLNQSSTVTNRLAKIISYVGAFVQAMLITYTYFLFSVQTNADITRPRDTELPAVSLCFFYNRSEMALYYDENGREVTNLTLRQINDMLPTWEQFMINCEVLNKSYKYENCSTFHTNVVSYVSLYSKCYRIFERLNDRVFYSRKLARGRWLVNVVLNVSKIQTNKIGMFMTPIDVDLQESLGNPSFLQFDTMDNNRAVVTYSRTIINLLPHPYSTNCFNYETLDCKNRESCIKRCLMKESFKEDKQWPSSWYVIYKPDEPDWLNGRFSNKSGSKLYEKCYNKYHDRPCLAIMDKAMLSSEFNTVLQTNDTFRISIAYPFAKQSILNFTPDEYFLTYFSFLASILALWTQISVLKILTLLFQASINFYFKVKGHTPIDHRISETGSEEKIIRQHRVQKKNRIYSESGNIYKNKNKINYVLRS